MKFNYLKLSLLMMSFVIAPVTMYAQADIDGAAKLLLELTDTNGSQKTIDQTIATVDQIIAKLQGAPEYKETCDALHEFKNTLVQFNVAQAKGILGRVTNQLEDMYHALSDGMKSQLQARLEQLKKLSIFQQGKLLSKLGVTLPKWGK
jgi:hypothetical protein